jgi:uncharacterized sulfatase
MWSSLPAPGLAADCRQSPVWQGLAGVGQGVAQALHSFREIPRFEGDRRETSMTTGIYLPWRAVVWALACTVLLPLTSGTVIGTEHGAPAPAAAVACSGDPLASARWGEMQRQFIGNAPFVFDPRVRSALGVARTRCRFRSVVRPPSLASRSDRLCRLQPDCRNCFYPEAVPASLGFRVKLQQSTPVRAAARTGDGVWHVGGSWVNTAGGGCTTPSLGSGSPLWQAQLNQVAARQWSSGPKAGRLRLKIVHPMDTGLVAGIPAFFLEEITLRDAAGQRLLRVQPAEPVAENPVFTLGGLGHGPVEASGRDNNGGIQHPDRAMSYRLFFCRELLCRQWCGLWRRLGCCLLSVLLLVGAGLPAALAEAFDYRLQPQQVAPGVYVLLGAHEDFDTRNGGNIVNTGFIVGRDGVIVIDSGPSRRYGEQLRAAIRRVTPLPPVLVLNTHHHPDHFLGNQAFAELPIAALPATRQGIAAEGNAFAENLYRLSGDWLKGTEVLAPNRELAAGTLEVAGRKLDLLALAGHTDADLVVIDRQRRDLPATWSFISGRRPPHAEIGGWLAALDALESPGPRPGSPGWCRAARSAPTRRRLPRPAPGCAGAGRLSRCRAGLDMSEVLQRPLPPELAQLPLAQREYRRSVEHWFPAIEARVLAEKP